MAYNKEQQHQRYLANKEKYQKKHKETYVSHPRKGEHLNEVIPVLLSIAKYDKVQNLDDTTDRRFTLHQPAIASFTKVSQPTVSRYIEQLVKDNVIERREQAYIFKDDSEETYRKSWLYTADEAEIDRCCGENGYKPSKALYFDYKKSLNEFFSNEKNELKKNWIEKNQKLFPQYEEIVKHINEYMPEECQLKYLWDGSGRLYSAFCSTPNPDNPGHSLEEMKERPNMLKDMFGIEKYIEYDTAASIYRLTYNLNHSLPFSEDSDIYEEVWKTMGLGEIPGFHETIHRTYLKRIMMPIYMKEGSITYSVNQFFTHIIDNKNLKSYSNVKSFFRTNDLTMVDEKGTIFLIPKAMKQKYVAWAFFMQYYCGWNREFLTDFLKKLCFAMKKVMFGLSDSKFYSRNIFIYESNVHIRMLEAFLSNEELIADVNSKRILQIANAYDGFYSNEGVFTKEMFMQAYFDSTNIVKAELKDIKEIPMRSGRRGLLKKEIPVRRVNNQANQISFDE